MAVVSAASVAGSAVSAFTVRGDASRLSSSNAFRATSLVQVAPVRSSRRSNLVLGARATLSEDSKAARREVLLSILSAGAALSFPRDAFADPIATAKGQATDALAGAKDAAPTLPSVPSSGGIQSAAENVSNDVRVDEATKKVGTLGSSLQKKGSEVISEGKGFLGQAKGSPPSLPDLIPRPPSVPELPSLPDFKGAVQSKVEDAKSASGGVLQ